MAVAVITDVPQGTAEMYDAVSKKLSADGTLADGQIVHTMGLMEGGGFRVFDVWETREAFEKFAEERLGPAVDAVVEGQAGEMPDRTIYELHNVVK
jgi:hypothetical protein